MPDLSVLPISVSPTLELARRTALERHRLEQQRRARAELVIEAEKDRRDAKELMLGERDATISRLQPSPPGEEIIARDRRMAIEDVFVGPLLHISAQLKSSPAWVMPR